MSSINCRIAIVSQDAAWAAAACEALQKAGTRLANPFGLCFAACSSRAEVQSLIETDGEVQGVLVDHALAGVGADPAMALIESLWALRPELSFYLVLAGDEEEGEAELMSPVELSGCFYRDEADFAGWFRILSAEMAERSATPFYDALREYVAMAKDAWHTPGHSGGESLLGSPWVEDFHDFVGENMLRADLSVSVPELDSLLHPTGVIQEAQARAAKAFGARETFFATNGSSTANKVILQSLLSPGDVLLLDRNCHKSVHHAVILSGARPVYLDASLNRRYGIFGPVPKARILDAIEAHPEAKALILTSCTYDGLRYDLAPLIGAAHAAGIKVVIDEAWYGHARFHPQLRPTAMEAGADYATQSTHKVLSAFSQASMIHVQDPDFDAHLFRECFNMHASTSPQYGLIASLDVARRQAVMEGYRLLSRALKLAAELKRKIDGTGVFRVLEMEELLPDEIRDDGVRLDPTKLTVDISRCGWRADELQRALFERFNIQVEKTTFNTLTLLLTIGTTKSKVTRLCDAFGRLAREARPPLEVARLPEMPAFTQLACLPRDAFYEAGERLTLLDDDGRPNQALIGRVSCDQIVPYPPGIPVLVPGQLIDEAVLVYLARLIKRQKGVEIHGMASVQGEEAVRVLSVAELERVRPR